MTSGGLRSRAGYKTTSFSSRAHDKRHEGTRGHFRPPPAPPSPSFVICEIEAEVHALLEQSMKLLRQEDLHEALETAKKAGKRDMDLVKYREANGLVVEDGHGLSYATLFHLALAYESNQLPEEAVKTYMYILRQKKFLSKYSWRARVNLGNIRQSQGDYAEAIRSYRMALDQIPPEERQIGFKICHNMGTAFIKQGKYREATQSFDAAMAAKVPDVRACFNLFLCQLAKRDEEKSKQCFVKLISLIPSKRGNEDFVLDEKADDSFDGSKARIANGIARGYDDLDRELAKRQKVAEDLLFNAARLVVSIHSSDSNEGGELTEAYSWAISRLMEKHEHLACRLELEVATKHLRERRFGDAMKILESFEGKDNNFRTMASTNLSFVHLLRGRQDLAEEHAKVAASESRYNASALVNLGNCSYADKDFDQARAYYLEAIGVQSDCFQAIYNLGLANMKLEDPEEAVRAFEKLHRTTPNNPEILHCLASLYEEDGQHDMTTKWLTLIANSLDDPAILAKLGRSHSSTTVVGKVYEGGESHVCHLKESTRRFPDPKLLGELGVAYAQRGSYKEAMETFELGAQLLPQEVKWRLMQASCLRRSGNDTSALQLYRKILEVHPDNDESLRYIAELEV